MTSSIKKTKEGGVHKLRTSWGMMQDHVTVTLTCVTTHASHELGLGYEMPVTYLHEMRRQGGRALIRCKFQQVTLALRHCKFQWGKYIKQVRVCGA